MNAGQNLFMQKVVPAAIQSQRIYGLPASVTIAQAILESGWGESALAIKANNYFGIKAVAHCDPDHDPNSYIEFPTDEFVDGRRKSVMAAFARYPEPAESFLAHAKLISNAPRYAPAMKTAHSPGLFAYALQRCGYSTNPQYGEQLVDLIDDYDLTQYDIEPEPSPAQAKENAA